MTIYYKFTAASAGEGILTIGQDLAKSQQKNKSVNVKRRKKNVARFVAKLRLAMLHNA